MSQKKVLVTGVAGFVGSYVADALLKKGTAVIGVDNLNSYYDPTLKQARLDRLQGREGFVFKKIDFADRVAMQSLFEQDRFDVVIHLGAQAGVRYSLENPHAYADSNLMGFLNVLEGCRAQKTGNLIYASSSSVYGLNRKTPFAVGDSVDHPVSLYAATKKANELMAHSYSHLYRIPTTGLRFFTVYGPWGRPDMAYFNFTKSILKGEPIKVFNHGKMKRDFTYIDDIVEGIVRLADLPAAVNPVWDALNPANDSSSAPYRLYNIGNHSPVDLLHFIQTLEGLLGKKAVMEMLPMQPGDVLETVADVQALEEAVGFSPKTPIEEGLAKFVTWYREFYRV
jgi:UDP-glucuronate 4-epimerase